VQLSLQGVSIGCVVMRASLFLGLCGLVLCVAALPFCIVLVDTDAPGTSSKAVERDDDDDDDDDDEPLAWLTRAAALMNVVPPADEHTTAAQLDALDRAMAAGVDRCAPEIFELDRPWLTRLQPQWGRMKPNFRPAWDAWLAVEGIQLDATKARACANLLRTGDCAAIPAEWEACQAPFRGTFGEEEPCTFDDQCLSETCLAGACTAPNDCEDDDDCPRGMACTGEDYFYTCTETDEPEEPEEEPTRDDEPRVFGPGGLAEAAYASLDERDGDEEEERDDDDDDDDAYDDCVCDSERDGKACIEDRCVQAAVVDVGEACDELHVCHGVLRSAVCLEGTCTVAFSVGHECSDHNECKDDLRCLEGACESPRHAGDPCDDDAACAFGLSCVDGDDDDDGSVCGLGLSTTQRPAPRRVIYLDGFDLHYSDPNIDYSASRLR
jgi:hypothetical protein